MPILLLLLALLTAAPRALSAQVIRGNLFDQDTERPLAGATMTLLGRDSVARASVVTDSAGAFLLQGEGPGAFLLRAELSGFQSATSPTFRLGTGDTLDVEYYVSTRIVVLEPLVVTGRARRPAGPIRGYYERLERRAWGRFFTRQDVERLRPVTTTELLRRVPGVSLTPRTLGGGHHVVVRGGCSPSVWVDGVLVRLMGSTIDDLVSPLDLEGMEVYRSAAEAPVEYGGLKGGCAVILLWTRHGP
jgi:hypothetical protein